MKHPQILLLPVLMLLDYFLTVLGAVQKEKRYSDHFKAQHYELNPIWQESIRRKRWFNPRHLLLTILTSSLLAAALQFSAFPDFAAECLFGWLFVFFGTVIGRHLSNILIFRRFARNPTQISGKVAMDHSLILAISTYQYLVVAVPILIISIFNPTPFVLGGLLGIVSLFAIHGAWIQKFKSTQKNKVPSTQPSDKSDLTSASARAESS